MVTLVGSFGKCSLLISVELKVVHSGADFSLYVFGSWVLMKEVQYAWIVGIEALSGALEVPQMDWSSDVCVTPRPFAAFLGERTSHLFKISMGSENLRKVNVPIVVACRLTIRAKHCADINAGTYISHLTVRISSCTPIHPSSRKLLALREVRVDLLEIRFGEICELIFEKVIHISD